MQKTISILVSGKVQGVFFRKHTKEKAVGLGITGMVTNLPDGRVKIIATGTEHQLTELLDWCKAGPPRAIVSAVEIHELAIEHFHGFTIV